MSVCSKLKWDLLALPSVVLTAYSCGICLHLIILSWHRADAQSDGIPHLFHNLPLRSWFLYQYQIMLLVDRCTQVWTTYCVALFQTGVETTTFWLRLWNPTIVTNHFAVLKLQLNFFLEFEAFAFSYFCTLFCQDYMDDVHSKEIVLIRTTVKLPGGRPRGCEISKSASSTPAVNGQY